MTVDDGLRVHGESLPAAPEDLAAPVRDVLHSWDPIGVHLLGPGAPDDEYDCLIPPLLGRLRRGDDAGALGRYLQLEASEHFGVAPMGGAEACGRAASRLLGWWRSVG